mgnify:CR=1 FL=1
MTTLLYSHPACEDHIPNIGHPEAPVRLNAIREALSAAEFDALDRREAPKASVEQIARAHPQDYVESILAAVPESGERHLDGDTVMTPGTGDAILRGSGAVCAAVDAVLAGEAKNAFCAMRPPGHHAEPRTPMGFCFFNQIAVGADHARAAHGLRRVAIVDFDVHHGNGTQAIFYDRNDVLTISLHGDPDLVFPHFLGFEDETGEGAGEGYNLNMVYPPNTPYSVWSQGLEKACERIQSFQPDALVVALGVDTFEEDPISFFKLTSGDYLTLGQRLARLGLPTVFTMEGGYDVDAIGVNAVNVMQGFDQAAG